VFETDRQLKDFVADFLASKSETFDLFLASKRFSLSCVDGVVADPEQVVYVINGSQAEECKAELAHIGSRPVFIDKAAAEDHLRNTARVLCLDDLEDYIEEGSVFWGLLNGIVKYRLK
jgi:hypothetical protein